MPRRKKRSESRISLVGTVIFFLLVSVFCCYVFYFTSRVPEKKTATTSKIGKASKPTPSTPSPPLVNYSRLCQAVIDRVACYCSEAPLSERDFIINERLPVCRGGRKWFFTKATIYLPQEVDPASAAGDIVNAVEDLDAVSCRWERRGDGGGSLTVRIDGTDTHAFFLLHRPPRLAIIIDDIGQDIEITKRLLEIGYPLTLSILPGLPDSKESEELANRYGYEVMLHLPMEPKNSCSHNPGRDAVLSHMGQAEIGQTIMRHVSRFSHIKGVNNHMGSLITEDRTVTGWILEALKPTGLYFIDSRTSSESVAYDIARAMGIPCGANCLFLDSKPGVSFCREAVRKVIGEVKKRGSGIAIGHPREATLQALKEMEPAIRKEGISMVFASELVR
ncbi:MAG: divergent polysaccharide deacetylase family protein [Deltaproteobacteria bacterium]|nr:divergent polysaccharide deacetylase family protein [Deltaproteobacteria bacterium]